MKRIGGMYSQILERQNFRLAFYRASLGKRHRNEVRSISANLDFQLSEILQAVQLGEFPFGQFTQFEIRDPKLRTISAPRFSERIVHHAIMNVCEPWFDRALISDTYACRKGLGRDCALRRAQQFASRFPVYLKLDIRKYFDSISHEKLLQMLARKFKDNALLELFHTVVSSFRPEIGVGLPIGSLTSQHFANCFLGTMDRFVKEHLCVRGYVRYMDDMVIWGESSRILNRVRQQCEAFLDEQLALSCKSTAPQATRTGMSFLGCRVFPTHIALNQRSKKRFRTKLRDYEAMTSNGAMTPIELQQRIDAMLAFARSAGIASWRFRSAVLHRHENAARSFRDSY